VWIADQAAGVARKQAIETGSRGTREMVEVTSGLTVASRLIASPSDGLSDGEAIQITGEANE